MPMSEIKTADSMATHNTHNKINVVARKLIILNENGLEITTIYHVIFKDKKKTNQSFFEFNDFISQ